MHKIGIALCLSALLFRPLSDPDLWWHIVVGRWIIFHKEFPSRDHWSMFAHGDPWIAYSWLIEVALAWIDAGWKEGGLYITQSALAVILGLAIVVLVSVSAPSLFQAFMFSTALILCCFDGFALRPQSMAWICFIGALCSLSVLCRSGLSIPRAAALYAFTALWANVHISVCLGVLVALLWISLGKFTLREKAILILLTVLGSVSCPYPTALWELAVRKSAHPFQFAQIAEFQPLSLRDISSWALICLYTTALYLFVKNPRHCAAMLILLLCLGLLAVLVRKFVPFAGIASAWLILESGGISWSLKLPSARLLELFCKWRGFWP